MYRERRPPEALAPYIRCIWFMTRDYSRHPEGETVWPDGKVELLFHRGARYRLAPQNQPLPAAMLIGPLTHAISLTSPGELRLVGVRFHPWGLAAFCQEPMHRLRDRVVAAADLFGPTEALTTRLAHAAEDQAADLLARFLAERLQPARLTERPGVLWVAEQIMQGEDPARLIAQSGWSARQLERQFRDLIGLGPKRLSIVRRFDAARRELLRSPETDLLDLAFRLGYYDYPHFSRDFRSCLRMTPQAYLRWAAQLKAAWQKQKDVVFVQES